MTLSNKRKHYKSKDLYNLTVEKMFYAADTRISSHLSLRIYVYNPKVHLLIKEKVKITVKMDMNTDIHCFCIVPQKYKVILPFRVLANEHRGQSSC